MNAFKTGKSLFWGFRLFSRLAFYTTSFYFHNITSSIYASINKVDHWSPGKQTKFFCLFLFCLGVLLLFFKPSLFINTTWFRWFSWDLYLHDYIKNSVLLVCGQVTFCSFFCLLFLILSYIHFCDCLNKPKQ
jgi:hypothetical protein